MLTNAELELLNTMSQNMERMAQSLVFLHSELTEAQKKIEELEFKNEQFVKLIEKTIVALKEFDETRKGLKSLENRLHITGTLKSVRSQYPEYFIN